MIPIKTNVVSRHFAAVTVMLIGLNVFAFAIELNLGRHLDKFLLFYGLVPVRYVDPVFYREFTPVEQLLPFFTSMFLHGGWIHIISNMWFLWIFGGNLESSMGRGRYLVFYLVCGLGAAAIHLASVLVGVNLGLLSPRHMAIPTIGASGAIAGVMGAYLVLFPRARVLTLVPVFIFLHLVALPAYIFLGIWFIIQFFSGSFGLLSGSGGGVAWWAHIGGFVVGALLAKVFRRSPPRIGR